MSAERETTSRPREARRSLPRAVIVLGWVSFFTDASADMIYPLVPAFLLSLGGGATALGWLEGVAEAVSAAIKLWAGRSIDRAGKPKRLVVLGYAIAALSRPLYALATAPVHAVLVRVADRVGKGLRGPPRDAMLAAVVEPGRRGHAFGYHRMMDNFGGVAGPLLAFVALRIVEMPLRQVFVASVVPGLVSVLIAQVFLKDLVRLHGAIREKEVSVAEGADGEEQASSGGQSGSGEAASVAAGAGLSEGASVPEGAGAVEGSSLPEGGSSPGSGSVPEGGSSPGSASLPEDAGVAGQAGGAKDASVAELPWRFFLVTVVFTLAASGDLFLMQRLTGLGLDVALVPVAWVSLQLMKGLFNVPGGRASDRFGRRRVLALAWLLYAATYVGFGLAGSPWVAWALLAPYALHYGLAEGGQRALLTDLVPASLRGRAFGVQLAIEGVFILPANVGFGWLVDHHGALTAFSAAAACSALAAVLLVTIVPRPAHGMLDQLAPERRA